LNDVLEVSENHQITVTDAEENDIVGTIDAETINGTAADDYIQSGGGDDIIDGAAGNDTLVLDVIKIIYNPAFFPWEYTSITVAGLTKVVANDNSIVRMTNVESILADTDGDGNQEYYSISWEQTVPGENIIWGSSESETITGTDLDDVIDSA
jgi:Ca2+-binding RTX toxin-like protein